MIVTGFRIARAIPEPIGPLRLSIDNIPCEIEIVPSPRREQPPVGGAIGPGARATLKYEPAAGLDDGELVFQTFELAIKATNRLLHAAAFLGQNEKTVPLLGREHLEEVSCVDDRNGQPRDLDTSDFFTKRPLRLKLTPDTTLRVQQVLAPFFRSLSHLAKRSGWMRWKPPTTGVSERRS
jgi:hypothetical protein